ncbi:NADPH-dependent FMN reductase [Marinicella pacifica]|uniref:NADPH-dependent FMN reductase n=1 Tax=Marinicella pacifica TaxID=1171543 RepID=A0A917FM29_9GAMM|nr:NAD(P)H-dependent oxidoreductase [Marinicella pacifica]GGF88762.1 NADPH-dependent FMN reductase [Marinicella pacifica]
MAKKNIALIVGSLRKDSYNRKVAHELMRLAPDELDLNIVEIGDLPLYNEDLEAETPQAWSDFRHAMKSSDGVIFISPEYNRSIPGALKNAIDVGSRPYGQSVWQGLPGAVITASQSAIGGFGSNHNIRQAVVFLDIPMMPQPEAYIGQIQNLLDDNDRLVPDTEKFVQKFIDSYHDWFNKLRR